MARFVGEPPEPYDLGIHPRHDETPETPVVRRDWLKMLVWLGIIVFCLVPEVFATIAVVWLVR